MFLNKTSIKLINAILLVIIFYYLNYTYRVFIFGRYGYEGFLFEFNQFKHNEAQIILLVNLLIIFFLDSSGFIYAIANIISVFVLIPNLIVYQYMEMPRMVIYGSLFYVFCMTAIDIIPLKIKVSTIKPGQQEYSLLFLSLLLLIPFLIGFGLNLHFNAFNFYMVYDIRASSLEKYNLVTSYTFGWLGNFILPVLLITGIQRRKIGIIILSICMLLYMYLITGHKMVFFGMITVMIFYLVKDYHRKILFLLSGLFILFIICRLSTIYTGDLMFESLIVRRVFILPAQLNIFYFDFFKNNPVFLSHSILKHFIEYPYQLEPSHMIGLEYYNDPMAGANNGIISDGYMNFGPIGIFIYVIIVAVLFKFFAALQIHSRYFGIFFLTLFIFNSSALLTSLLTHGVLILILLSIFYIGNSQVFKHYAQDHLPSYNCSSEGR